MCNFTHRDICKVLGYTSASRISKLGTMGLRIAYNDEQNSKQNDEATNKTNDEQEKQEPAKEVKSYRLEDKGEKIKEIQRILNKFNYSLSVDGFFCPETLRAVKDFQRRNKIPVDGIVGEQTIYKLSLKSTKETVYTPPKNPEASKDTSSTSTIEAFVNGKGLSSTTKYLIWVNTETRNAYVLPEKKAHGVYIGICYVR